MSLVALSGTGIRKGNEHEPYRLHCRLRRHRHLCLGLFRPSVDLHAGARGALDRPPGNLAMSGTFLRPEGEAADMASRCVWRTLQSWLHLGPETGKGQK